MNLATIEIAKDRDPWDRQPGETATRYAHFEVYRAAGRTRTMRETCERLKLSPGHVYNLCSAGRWTIRAQAWDRHLDALYAAQMIEERRRAAQQDAQIITAMKTRVVKALKAMADEDTEPLAPKDVAAWTRVIMSARAGLFGADVMREVGGAFTPPTDPAEALIGGFTSPPADQSAADARALELLRYDRLQAALWPMAQAGDVAAAREIGRIMQGRARLLGLDATKTIKAVLTTEMDERIREMTERMRAAAARSAGP